MRNILWGILMIAIGIVLILFPGETMDITIKVVGVMLLVAGVCGVILGIRTQGAYQAYTLSGAVAALVVGIICLSNPEILENAVPMIMGVVILVTGVFNVVNVFNAKRAGASRWMASLIMAIITIASGVIILMNLGETRNLFVRIIGGVYVYNGLSILIMKMLDRV